MPHFYNSFDASGRTMMLSRPVAMIADEYIAWQFHRDPEDSDVRNPLAYRFKQQEQYPHLSQMEIDFMSNGLEAETVGTCQVLWSWH
ncbi:hypothetical protein F4859DRAFT_468114 [Xylaria cf. heliscus]|nr:hypothetical protein F4859DRAFT_468114 [Xylaria cf. heliscus]